MSDLIITRPARPSVFKKLALKFGLSGRPDSTWLHYLIEDNAKLADQFRSLENISDPRYRIEAKPSEKILAHQLLQIANASGFRLIGSLGGGSFHLMISYPEYTQIIRICLYSWPNGAEMSVDPVCENEGYKPSTFQPVERSRENPIITPPENMVQTLLELITLTQKVRAEYMDSLATNK